MAKSKEAKYKLSSLQAKKPGLLQLLFSRSFTVGYSDFVFHLGLWGNIITGILMEVPYMLTGTADVFGGNGWVLSWIHGITGLLILAGGIGLTIRYFRNPYFRVAYGRVFWLDFVFMLAFAAVGLVQLSEVLGIITLQSFGAPALAFFGSLHLPILYAWLVVSFFAGGAVRHGIATLYWRFTKNESRTNMLAFASACGKCGRCVEVCPTYEAFNRDPMEAPVLKLRKYYQIRRTRKFTPIELRYLSEQLATCTQCNLCAGVCPFSYNFVTMYNALLEDEKQIAPKAQTA
ncbi:MAG TPA: 4Fe-4S dicluster domain-containing protein [Conexivisphaerales archaeon]|nr:4Fe-4S dicluster domain-containing protein [Conexivisphaerales archaeon]